MASPHLSQIKGTGMEGVSTRIWGLAIGGLLLLALAFWLGGRFGGGMSKGEVETIVADYIKANPQIIPEALEAQRKGEIRSEEHTSELQSLMRISYADFCLQKKN